MRSRHSLYPHLGIAATRLRLRDLCREAVISIVRYPARSMLTAIGTVLGSAAFVATLGISSTVERQVSDSFDIRRATEVRIVPAVDGVDGGDAAWTGADRMAAVGDLNGVVSAGRRLSLGEAPVSRTTGGTGSLVSVIGADPGALAVMEPRIVAGRPYDDFHEREAAPVVLVPSTLSQSLGITRVGVAVFIGDRALTVIGIFDDVARRPEALVGLVMPVGVARELQPVTGGGQWDALISTAPGAAQLIARQAPYALLPEAPAELKAIAPPDPRTLRREVEDNITRSSMSVSVIALLIGSVSIANAATAGIGARIGEIGLRRAVGARRVHIFVQLLAETTALGAVGGLVGVVVGLLVTVSVALVNSWAAVLDWRAALLASGISAACGLAAGFWPAVRATRISPVAALQR